MKKPTPCYQVKLTSQLAVFIENRPGTLARVCSALAETGINIHAMTTSDTVDHTVLRLVVNDPRRALFLFEERNVLVVETEVLMVEADNRPGSVVQLAETLAQGKVNIEYLYCATSPRTRHGVIVLRVSNPRKALKLIEEAAAA